MGFPGSGQPLLLASCPFAMTIRHSVSGSEWISRRLCSGSSTQQAFASASASIALGATTVALATRSTGSPVRGSKTCEYHLPPIRRPALGASAGGDRAVLDFDEDQRIARFRVGPGSGDPDGPAEVAADPQVASHVQKNAR